MTAFSKLNFDDLPVPEILAEKPESEIHAEIIADFKANFPQYADAVEFESDPIAALIQSFAHREAHHRAFINQGVRASMLAFAEGAALDQHAALIPLARNPGEKDSDFRRRIQLAPEGLSVAGPDGAYLVHTQGVSAEILDVAVVTPEPGFIHVYIYQSNPITAARLNEINTALSPLRPLTDFVTVKPFIPFNYSVSAVLTLSAGVNAENVLQNAEAAARAYADSRRKFGKTVFRSALAAAMQVDGVESVSLTSPAADVKPASNGVAVSDAFNILEASND